MPIFTLKCKICNSVTDQLCTYEDAKNTTCDSCGRLMDIAPSKSNFKIRGFSEANSYSNIDNGP